MKEIPTTEKKATIKYTGIVYQVWYKGRMVAYSDSKLEAKRLAEDYEIYKGANLK